MHRLHAQPDQHLVAQLLKYRHILPTQHRTVSGGEDVAIFEQLRHQMLVWLRVEAVHCGLDISGQSPTQLLDALRQQGSSDETRLQVVSSLLNFADQVIKNGQASLLEYKQAMMFHLMHTRSGRPL